jgi:hypothetical protein
MSGPRGAPWASPPEGVTVVAHEPLDASGHGHIVRGQGTALPAGEGYRHAIAADVDGGLATGGRNVEGDAADEPRCGVEVVEMEGLTDAVAVELPAAASEDR